MNIIGHYFIVLFIVSGSHEFDLDEKLLYLNLIKTQNKATRTNNIKGAYLTSYTSLINNMIKNILYQNYYASSKNVPDDYYKITNYDLVNLQKKRNNNYEEDINNNNAIIEKYLLKRNFLLDSHNSNEMEKRYRIQINKKLFKKQTYILLKRLVTILNNEINVFMNINNNSVLKQRKLEDILSIKERFYLKNNTFSIELDLMKYLTNFISSNVFTKDSQDNMIVTVDVNLQNINENLQDIVAQDIIQEFEEQLSNFKTHSKSGYSYNSIDNDDLFHKLNSNVKILSNPKLKSLLVTKLYKIIQINVKLIRSFVVEVKSELNNMDYFY